jgi:methylmalonyl-CoA/ethylmalonyl-CoA epimerase
VNVVGLHHAGILVANPEPLTAALEVLGMPLDHVEHYGTELDIGFHNCGNALVEVITPRTAEGWNAAWLERNGPTIQHVAFEVRDLDGALDELRGRGIPMLEPAPRPGAGGTTIAFLDPRSTGSILFELVFDPGRGRAP